MAENSGLTAEQSGALVDALHAGIDGDFLVDADGFGEDIAISRAGAADVVRWAVNVVEPVVARLLRAEQNVVVQAEDGWWADRESVPHPGEPVRWESRSRASLPPGDQSRPGDILDFNRADRLEQESR